MSLTKETALPPFLPTPFVNVNGVKSTDLITWNANELGHVTCIHVLWAVEEEAAF